MKKFLLYSTLCIYCILMGACNLFEVRKPNTTLATATTEPADTDVHFSNSHTDTLLALDTIKKDNTTLQDTALLPPSQKINTGTVPPEAVLQFAQRLTGTPYVYASTNPAVGFDCSGFITYVFNHFNIAVPRSSVDFTRVGKTVAVEQAKRGDLILFTGTDSTEKQVGHMGLVVSNDGPALQFIHSTSGKAMGVTTTPLNDYYKKRFVRVARIFPQNE